MTIISDNSKGRSRPLGTLGGSWRLLIIPVLLIMILPIGSSAYMFHANPQHTGVYNDAGSIPTNALKWVYNTNDNRTLDSDVYASPVVVNNVLYIGDNGQVMRAINAATGAPIWNSTVSNGDIDSTVAVVGNIIYFGSYDCHVYALSTDNVFQWSVNTSNKIRTSPTVVDGVLYIGNDDGRVYAIRTSDHVILWNKTTGPNAMHASPAVANGYVFTVNDNGILYALNATSGDINWTKTIDTAPTGATGSSPAVANGVVYVGSLDGNLYAYTLAGDSVPNFPVSLNEGTRSSPAVANGVVYIGGFDNNLHAISTSGSPLWTFPTGGDIVSSPGVANGVVYVGSTDGKLYAVFVNGTKLWDFTTRSGEAIDLSSPVQVNGTVYFGVRSSTYAEPFGNRVYAVGLGGFAPVVPVASFTANVTTGTAPRAVQFTDTSTNTPTAWSWSFRNVAGNNTEIVFSTAQNPVHSFGAGNFSIVLNASNSAGFDLSNQVTFINVTAPVAPTVSKIAVYRNGVWIIDNNANFAWDGAVIDKVVSFQNRPITQGDMGVSGDWNGDGTPEVGIYDGSGNWYLDYNGNGVYDGPVTDRAAGFGSAGYKPVVGDWTGTGTDKIGVELNGIWAIDYNGNYVWDGAVTDRFAGFGSTGDNPVIGDWDGTGIDKIGSEKDGFWAIDYNGNFVWDGEVTDRFAGFGQTGDKPVIGDWNGDGKDKIGMEINGFWATDYNGNYLWEGVVIDRFAGFGSTGDSPVVGDWNLDGTDKIGSFKDGFWAIDYNANYVWDGEVTDRFAGFGQTGDTTAVGKWI